MCDSAPARLGCGFATAGQGPPVQVKANYAAQAQPSCYLQNNIQSTAYYGLPARWSVKRAVPSEAAALERQYRFVPLQPAPKTIILQYQIAFEFNGWCASFSARDELASFKGPARTCLSRTLRMFAY